MGWAAALDKRRRWGGGYYYAAPNVKRTRLRTQLNHPLRQAWLIDGLIHLPKLRIA